MLTANVVSAAVKLLITGAWLSLLVKVKVIVSLSLFPAASATVAVLVIV